MTITFRRGKKSDNDLKCSFICDYCGKFHDITFEEFAQCILELCRNEDGLFPPEKGLRGGQMLLDFFQEAYDINDITDGLMKKYKLKRWKK